MGIFNFLRRDEKDEGTQRNSIFSFLDDAADTAERYFAPSADKVRTRDVIRELPKAARDTGVAIARSVPQAVASGIVMAKGEQQTQPEHYGSTEKFLLGSKDPIKDPITQGRELLEGVGVKPDTAKKWGALGIPLVASDLALGGGGKKVITKELVKAGSADAVRGALKSVPRILNNLTEDAVEKLVKAKDVGEVTNILNSVSKTADANKAINVTNTTKTRDAVLAGQKETDRLTDPKALQIAKDYQSNPIPKDATPDTAVPVYRVADPNKPIGQGDFVSLNREGAEKYLKRSPDLKLTQEEVPLGDLVYGGGTRNEYVYAPREASTEAGSSLRASIDPESAAPTVSPIEKLRTIVKEAKPEQMRYESAKAAGRKTQYAKLSQARENASGREAYLAGQKAAAGEIAERPSLIEGRLDDTDVDQLHEAINSSPRLHGQWDKQRAGAALEKVFKGELPQPAELALLEDVYGPDLVEDIVRKEPTLGGKIKGGVTEVLGLSRTLKTILDASAVFRQGGVASVAHPVKATGALKESFAQTFSPERSKEWLETLYTSPEYRTMKDAGLYISDPNRVIGGKGAREEGFMSDLAKEIPILREIVGGSERNYTGYLNKLRVDVFSDLASRLEVDGQATPENLKGLARFVNNATGRGSLGKWGNKNTAELNGVFFSPRNAAAKYNLLLNPKFYKDLPAPVRKQAVKDMAKVTATGLTILGLAKAGGAEVSMDPTSSDFGKIKIGNTRWDIWGGFQQWAVLTARVLTSAKQAVSGEDLERSPVEDVVRFARGKLAPTPGTAVNIVEGKNVIGEETTASGVARESISPLYLEDLNQAVEEEGLDALLTVGVPGFFGIGTQTYKSKGTKKNTAGGRIDAGVRNAARSRAKSIKSGR